MSTDSEGYVHRPGVVEGEGSTDEDDDASEGTMRGASAGPSADGPGAADDGFGRRGWLLVAAVVFGFLVVPGIIYLRPATPAEAGLPYLASMLVLPLLPAVLLGLVAVWSMSGSARSRR